MPNAGRAQTATTALRPQKAGFAFSLRLMIDEESFEQGIVVLPYLVGYSAARQNALGNQLGYEGQERLDAMLGALKALPGYESLYGQVENAVRDASVKELETARKDTMRCAAISRAKGKTAATEYMQLIKLAAELQKIVAVLRKRNLKTANGEMLLALKRLMRNLQRNMMPLQQTIKKPKRHNTKPKQL